VETRRSRKIKNPIGFSKNIGKTKEYEEIKKIIKKIQKASKELKEIKNQPILETIILNRHTETIIQSDITA
jgi:hypothetical protein